jgi:hypothetical protein
MINKKNLVQFSVTIISLFLIQSCLYACPRCNQEFYDELLGKRANTLGGQELLEAIRNQTIPGQPSGFSLPSATNNLTDIQQPNVPDTSLSNISIEGDNNPSDTTKLQPLYIRIIAQLVFFGNLLS